MFEKAGKVTRCSKCVLPENYPGIIFNEDGVCNYCTGHRERRYLGNEAFEKRIKSFLQTKRDRNTNYDCVLALSGGRDSSYLLYYLVKVLDLRVLAYSIDNGFIPGQTKQNMKDMVDILGVELVVEKDEHLEKCIKHHLLSFIRRPSAPMVGVLCTGCRLSLDTRVPNFARKNKIPVVIYGANPMDARGYKQKIMALDPNSKNPTSFILGYLRQIAQNPLWLLNYRCLITQIEEYYHHFYRKGAARDLMLISPFYSYIRWEEKEVVSTIEDTLRWRKNPDTESTWRGDCEIALVKLYLYKKTLGFNDKDEGLSYLVRDGQISRAEALERLKVEGEISEEVMKEFFDKLGLDFSSLKRALSRVSFI